MPFTDDTLEFLVRNKLMDSREWFHEHHGEYERLVVEPLAELVSALTFLLVSFRVWLYFGRSFADWRTFLSMMMGAAFVAASAARAARPPAGTVFIQGLPGFWFEFSPQALRWGCGWYQTEPATMAAFRELILRGDPAWRAALRAYRKQERFVLEPERYKRSRFPDEAPEKREWLDLKSICLTHNEPDLELLFSDGLAERVAEDFRSIAPAYELFLKAVAEANAPRAR